MRQLVAMRLAIERVAEILISLNIIDGCAAAVRQEEKNLLEVFTGLLITMHELDNDVDTATSNELVAALNISGGITGTTIQALAGKPNRRRRASELLRAMEREPDCNNDDEDEPDDDDT
ncbi:hypothetical protein Micbo1qcDRAFT_179295 [Microdochium bolleyi]|uniref:Uncharacterized protein n=1 Tax=Microdochium bolleyi TaxID=196109 RepID=A0A136IQ57_9PEZI|nr:hypothetical protein Micbo1qcDRAFT_179295 [Microdochium bolleyi]